MLLIGWTVANTELQKLKTLKSSTKLNSFTPKNLMEKQQIKDF